MKGGVRYRLSPNEAARIIQEEKERRRKLRIVQVKLMKIPNRLHFIRDLFLIWDLILGSGDGES